MLIDNIVILLLTRTEARPRSLVLGKTHRTLRKFKLLIEFLKKVILFEIKYIQERIDYCLIEIFDRFIKDRECFRLFIVAIIQSRMRRMLFNFSTEIGQQQNNMKRFYKQAAFAPNTNKKHPLHNYLLKLDGRTIKTPYRNILALPSVKLAFLVANQFNQQHKYLKTGEMPMLALCRTAVDADIQGHLAQHLRHSIYEYLKTDTLLFVDDTFEQEHKRLSTPLIENFVNRFELKLEPSVSIDAPKVEINDQFVKWVEGLNNWQLIGMETMTIWMKSTIAAYSIIGSTFSPPDIQAAAYIEQMTQMKSSGEVQEKIMDINHIKLMVSCGQMIYRFSSPDI